MNEVKENIKNENKNNKKKVIIIFICVLIIILLVLGVFIFINNKNKKLEDRNDSKLKIVLIDNLDVEINSEVNLLSFIKDNNGLEIISEDTKIDTSTLGEKELIIKYKEKDEEKEYKFSINIKDTTIPNIEYQKELSTTVGTEIDLLKDVKVSDNSLEEIKATVEGEYDFNKEGTYTLKYIASDSSNNKAEEEFTLKVNKKEERKSTTTSQNTQTSSNGKKVVKTETKTVKADTIKQYGVVAELYNVYKVYTYSDDTTNEEYDYSYNKLDSSGFNATTSELLPEATQFANEEPDSTYNNMLSILNGYRNEVGATPLELDKDLILAATVRAMEMAYSGKFSHERPNMSGNNSCFTVLSDLNISRSTLGENIAAGTPTVKSTMDGWRNSQGHYENMINPDFKKVGFALVSLSGSQYGYYAVQIFSD